ncbi:uncharacterized protein LOC114334961 [Diabrotica virgifera virgifera]|uniref:Uncharacterized protein LOC114334961 n=1 Tax=Diabrotica virgifera virgifera TaxID=50390 RepID=A0A6P7FWS7_DIAVI|nr:uncharacterized protein LOC114334961 [Diabrotica virgifera virgifera]
MFKLVTLFFAVAVAAHCVSAGEVTGELAKLGKVLHVACSSKFGVSEEEIDKLKKAEFDDHSDKQMNYLTCLYDSSGAINADDTLNTAVIEKLAPDAIKSTAPGVYKNCWEKQTETNKVQKRWNFQKCLYNAGSQYHIIL